MTSPHSKTNRLQNKAKSILNLSRNGIWNLYNAQPQQKFLCSKGRSFVVPTQGTCDDDVYKNLRCLAYVQTVHVQTEPYVNVANRTLLSLKSAISTRVLPDDAPREQPLPLQPERTNLAHRVWNGLLGDPHP